FINLIISSFMSKQDKKEVLSGGLQTLLEAVQNTVLDDPEGRKKREAVRQAIDEFDGDAISAVLASCAVSYDQLKQADNIRDKKEKEAEALKNLKSKEGVKTAGKEYQDAMREINQDHRATQTQVKQQILAYLEIVDYIIDS